MGRGSVTFWKQIKGFSGLLSKPDKEHILGHPVRQTSHLQSLKGRNRSLLKIKCVKFSLCSCFHYQYSTIRVGNDKRSNMGPVLETYMEKVNKKKLVNGGNMSTTPCYAKQWVTWKSEFFRRNLTKEYISELEYALTNVEGSSEAIKMILDQEASTLDTSRIWMFMDLLKLLQSRPQQALEAFNWKRQRPNISIKLEEYSKAIVLAGRAKNVDLATELFAEIESRGIEKEPSAYNALMTVYVCNGLSKKALALFEDFKRDPNCTPTIVTYNILLSTFGRSMLVDHMKMTMQAIEGLGLSPTIYTYNTLLAGYVTAWMWDEMEKIFDRMKRSSVLPNSSTYSLLVRGYAFSRQLKKMEAAFYHLQGQISQKDLPIIQIMIFAYSKSTGADKLRKIENLLKFIPKEDYRPWLNVLLINAYAEVDDVERMESYINRALDHHTIIKTTSVTRSVTAAYFRHDAIDKLEAFVKRVKSAGWKLCRSLYHGRMVLYGIKNRLNEMENVMEEMKSSRFCPTKKTYLILYKIYNKFEKEDELKWTLRRMKEAGFDLPEDCKLLQGFASLEACENIRLQCPLSSHQSSVREFYKFVEFPFRKLQVCSYL